MVKAPAPKANGSAPIPEADREITLTYGELQRLVEAHVTSAIANLRAEAVARKIQAQIEPKDSTK